MAKEWMTVEEHHKVLAQDTNFQASMAEEKKQWAEMEAMLDADEKPLIDALADVGRSVKSVWDLVNTSESYPEVIPVLAEHLPRPYHFRTREGIARALSVKEARGSVAHIVLEQLKKMTEAKNPHEDGYRFALTNTLVTIGDASMQDEIRQMLADPQYAKAHMGLNRALKAIVKRKPPKIRK